MYETVQVRLFSLTGGAETVNTNGWNKNWYLTSKAKYTDTDSPWAVA